MSPTFWEKIADTPWWYGVIFLAFLGASLSTTKPVSVPYRTLMTLPLLFISISVSYALVSFNVDAPNVVVWLAAFAIGISVGWLQFNLLKVKANAETMKIEIPGSISLLLLFLGFVFAKAYFGFEINLSTEALKDPYYRNIFMAVYGFATGFFTGRFLYARQLIKREQVLT